MRDQCMVRRGLSSENVSKHSVFLCLLLPSPVLSHYHFTPLLPTRRRRTPARFCSEAVSSPLCLSFLSPWLFNLLFLFLPCGGNPQICQACEISQCSIFYRKRAKREPEVNTPGEPREEDGESGAEARGGMDEKRIKMSGLASAVVDIQGNNPHRECRGRH